MILTAHQVQSDPRIAWTTPFGDVFTIRMIRPADMIAMREFCDSLSYTTRYLRFGHGDFHLSDSELMQVCAPDHQQCTHLVALITTGRHQQIVGSARFVAGQWHQCRVCH